MNKLKKDISKEPETKERKVFKKMVWKVDKAVG